MREIKFRAKAMQDTLIAGSNLYFNNEWVFGNLIIADDGTAIIQTWDRTRGVGYIHKTFAIVDLKTVGQYTGLKDKNGKEIYEGDILHHKWDSGCKVYLETISEVKFSNGAFVVDDKKRSDWLLSLHALPAWAELEVIGNIYENSELLNG